MSEIMEVEPRIEIERRQDHAGHDILSAWRLREGEPPAVYFPVYCPSASSEKLPDIVVKCVRYLTSEIMEDFRNVGVDLYTYPARDVLACTNHRRKELRFDTRQRSNIKSYADESALLVVSDIGYGITFVTFDPRSSVTTSSRPNQSSGNSTLAQYTTSEYAMNSLLGAFWSSAKRHYDTYSTRSPEGYPPMNPDSRGELDDPWFAEDDLEEVEAEGSSTSTEDSVRSSGDHITMYDLLTPDVDLPHLSTHVYWDLFGFPVTSVWDPQHSNTRPSFAMTVYVSPKCHHVQAKAIFECLNQGPVSRHAWTLDVITGMPSIEAAFAYNTHMLTRRRPKETEARSKTIAAILAKVVGTRLPVELVDQIHDIMLPPSLPDYSAEFVRDHRDVLLWLDDMDFPSLLSGPTVVSSNFVQSRLLNPYAISAKVTGDVFPRSIMAPLFQETFFYNEILRVINLQRWDSVAREIHNLWTLCNLSGHGLSGQDVPKLQLTIDIGREIFDGNSSNWMREGATVKSKMQSTAASRKRHSNYIAIDKSPFFDHDSFEQAFEIVNADDGTIVHRKPKAQFPAPERIYSRSSYFDGILSYYHPRFYESKIPGNKQDLIIIQQDQQMEMALGEYSCIPQFVKALIQSDYMPSYSGGPDGTLKSNGRYRLRLREGVTAIRWTFAHEVDGEFEVQEPFHHAPMEIELVDQPVFTVRQWDSPREGRPGGRAT